ncbi:hypothetical protein RI367_001040 [Sorochytrium milnesiophthora]
MLVRKVAQASPQVLRGVLARRWQSGSSSDAPFVTVQHDKGPDGKRTGVATVKLNRPSSLNALTEGMGDAFTQVMQELQKDAALRALILTGEGRAFSAGGDLQFLRARTKVSSAHNVTAMREFYSRFLSIRKLPVPTIAMINGPAIGAGMCLAMACDLRVASTNAKMGFNFVRIGLSPGMAGTFILPRVTNPQVATRLLLTGDIITGDEALRLGVVTSTSTADTLEEDTLTLARRIASASPAAVRLTTQALRASVDDGLDQGLWREAASQSICYTNADFTEGIDSIEAKRTPVFGDAKRE